MFKKITLLFTLTAFMAASASAELENHYAFDDADSITKDSSPKGRDGFLDDLEVEWVDDDERGGVLEFGGNTNGFLLAETSDELADGFTIMMWAYRDPDLCCGAGGANDGLFHVVASDALIDDLENLPTPNNSKVIGGWVQKADAALWGRVITADGNQNLSREYLMEDEEWVHLAYRGDGEVFEVVINGESGEGPELDYDGESLLDHDAIFIGRQGTETWGGRLDDVRIYSSALSNEEIVAIMNDGGDPGMLGDFNGNNALDVDDITALNAEILAGTNNAAFDLDNDNVVGAEDQRVWVEDLKNTYYGDANLDQEFNSSDLVRVFQAGKFETGNPATWSEGDWDGDGVFGSGDFVKAFQGGGFEQGPRPVSTVPEPSSLVLFGLGLLAFTSRRRR